MKEVIAKLKEIKDYMPYGKIKSLAAQHGVDKDKAYDVLSGRVEMTEAEEAFVFACFDLAKTRKARLEKLKTF